MNLDTKNQMQDLMNRLKSQDLEEKAKNNKRLVKVSKNIIESKMINSNLLSWKLIFYICLIEKKEPISDYFQYKLSVNDLKKRLNTTTRNIKENLDAMLQTAIIFKDDEDGFKGLSLLSKAEMDYTENILSVDIHKDIMKEMLDLKKRYTVIDTSVVFDLTYKNSIKMFKILSNINSFGDNIPKRKHYDLVELNDLFGVNYKNISEICRSVLEKSKRELDEKSHISFIYQIKKDLINGRIRNVGVIIDLTAKTSIQPSLF
jgi:hypothetical protein